MHPKESTEFKKISIASICLLDNMVHNENTVMSEHQMKRRKRLFTRSPFGFLHHNVGGLFCCFGGTVDHEDGLLSISHKPLVNSLKDSRQSLRMKLPLKRPHHLTLIPMPL
jgi:hypothetical protein